MRSIGNTTLSLGLLNAPIKLYPATSDPDVKFELCGPNGEAVEQVYRIKGTDTIVGTRNDCERMYESRKIDKDEIEKINDESLIEEIDGANVNLKETMTIQGFIPVKSIPFERVTGRYLIGPGKGSDQGLATIIKAMEKKKLAAVTKYCLRGRQGCFVLYVKDGVLNAVRLHFASAENEVTDEVTVEATPVKAHVDAAITLIEEYTDDDAAILDSMSDTLVEKKNALIDKALQGEPIEATPVPASDGGKAAGDLMDTLVAEVERARGKKKVAA